MRQVVLAGLMTLVRLMNWSFEEVGEICAGFFLVTFGVCFSSLGLWLVMRVFFVVSSMSSWGSFSL